MSSIKRLKYFSRKWFRGKSWGATEFLIFYQIHVRFKVRNKFVLFSYLFIIIIIIIVINIIIIINIITIDIIIIIIINIIIVIFVIRTRHRIRSYQHTLLTLLQSIS